EENVVDENVENVPGQSVQSDDSETSPEKTEYTQPAPPPLLSPLFHPPFCTHPNPSRQMASHTESGSARGFFQFMFFSPQSPKCLLTLSVSLCGERPSLMFPPEPAKVGIATTPMCALPTQSTVGNTVVTITQSGGDGGFCRLTVAVCEGEKE
ncbi:unnamed protein product, partial [Pleuronectes platessa]